MARSADMPPRCTPGHAPGGRNGAQPREEISCRALRTTRVQRAPMKTTPALLCACAPACGHAPAKPPPPAAPSSKGARARPVLPPPPDDPRDFAAELSEETRALLRAE